MCYEWMYWKSKAKEAEKREQPKTVSEKPAAEQPKPASATRKPEKVDTELEPV